MAFFPGETEACWCYPDAPDLLGLVEASGTVGLASLIRSDPEVDFEVALGGGILYGSWSRDAEQAGRHVFDLSAESVPLERVGFISTAFGGLHVGVCAGDAG